MSSAAVSNLTDGKPHSVEEVSQVTGSLLDIVAGRTPDVGRAPGLLITNEDVRRIRRYVSTGLALPTQLEEVRHLLGNQNIDVPGLQPQAIVRLYTDIFEHAKSWSELETDMRKVGSDLYVFAGNLITIAESMVEFIKGMDAYQTLQISDLTAEQLLAMPPVELVEGDRKRIPGLLSLVDDLKVHIKDHSASTTRTRVGVSAFSRKLKDQVAPAVALKIRLAGSLNTDEKKTKLTEEVSRLNELINQKVDEYEEYCDYKWIGFWWGAVGGVISLSIYGPKATAALEEKDRLIAQKQQAEKTIQQLDKLLSEFMAFETSLQDLKTRIDGASSSVSNIESLWVLLEELIDSSYDRIRNTHNGLYLVSLVSRFQTLISSWQQVRTQAFDLLTAFNKALEEPAA